MVRKGIAFVLIAVLVLFMLLSCSTPAHAMKLHDMPRRPAYLFEWRGCSFLFPLAIRGWLILYIL